ncbi:MAG: NAD(P)-binding protein, partial [Thermodesulfobacteriota bacterium]
MPENLSFIDSLTRCIRKVKSDVEDMAGAVSPEGFNDRFDFSKFTSTWFTEEIDKTEDALKAIDAVKTSGALNESVKSAGRAFFDSLNFPQDLPSTGQDPGAFLKGLAADALGALENFKIVSNLLIKYAVSWGEYALKEDRWDEIGYLGPRGKRLKPPEVIINNNIAMMNPPCFKEFVDMNPNVDFFKFYNEDYEEQMRGKNKLLKDNIEDISKYPDGYEADIVIVGTGPGGASAAYALSREAKGKKIVVLERGDLHTSEEFNQRERDMVPSLYQWPGFRLTDEYGIAVLQGNLVGGSAVLNHGICYKVPEMVTKDWKEKDGGAMPVISE